MKKEKEKSTCECKREWLVCIKAGMFVSHYQCKKCGKFHRVSD